jgi:CheY-like chemotaxis protein
LPTNVLPTPLALIVDDSMLIRHTVCRFLEELGFAVESATNGVEALEILKRVHPQLIVTDLQMPKMGGSELISELKKQPVTANIPVVVLAGRQSRNTVHEERADFIICKDIDIQEQLLQVLKATMGERALGQSAGR